MNGRAIFILSVASVLLPYARPELYRPPEPHKPRDSVTPVKPPVKPPN